MQDLLQQQQPSAASPRWLALKFPSQLWQLNGATWVPGGPAYTPAEVSAETCDISRPVLNARAAGRQELPCSASTLPPMHFPAQPKPRLVQHETMQSRASRPSLPHSTAEVPRIPNSPDHFFTQSVLSKHPDDWGSLCENPGRTRTRTRYFWRCWWSHNPPRETVVAFDTAKTDTGLCTASALACTRGG